MKKLSIIIIIGLILCSSTLAVAGALLSGDSTIELSKADKDTLATKGVIDPEVSELVCDGETCRACASQNLGNETDPNYYGMGCISISQRYCSSYSECGEEEPECEIECLQYTEYSDVELKVNRDEAFEIRWGGIAETIRERDARNIETKIDKGDITLSEK